MFDSGGSGTSFEEKTASLNEIAQAINQYDDRSLDFWKAQYNLAEKTLERSVSELHESRKSIFNFLKIDLLVASFIVGLFQFSVIDISNIPNFYLAIPFVALGISAAIFIHALFSMGSYVVGGTSGSYLLTLEDEFTEKEHYRTATTVFYKWSDKNAKVMYKTGRLITYGISATFASLGSVSALYVV